MANGRWIQRVPLFGVVAPHWNEFSVACGPSFQFSVGGRIWCNAPRERARSATAICRPTALSRLHFAKCLNRQSPKDSAGEVVWCCGAT